MAHYLLIDGNNIAFQSQTAAMDAKSRAKRLFCGEQETTAINGVLQALRELQLRYTSSHPLVLWDTGKAWRYRIYPNYKGNRKHNPLMQEAKQALMAQRPHMEPLLDVMGLAQITAENYEADDIAAFMADLLSRKGHCVTLVTRDRDWLQMVNENVSWYDRFKGRVTTLRTFEVDTGLACASDFSECKIFKGDAGDNVPGIAGVGDVAAENLVRIFGTPENFIDSWEQWVDQGGLANKHPLNRQRKRIDEFLADKPAARRQMKLNRALMDLRLMFGDKKLAAAIRKSPGRFQREALSSQLARLAFVKIKSNLDDWMAPFLHDGVSKA